VWCVRVGTVTERRSCVHRARDWRDELTARRARWLLRGAMCGTGVLDKTKADLFPPCGSSRESRPFPTRIMRVIRFED